MRTIGFLLLIVFLNACAFGHKEPDIHAAPILKPTSFEALDGWDDDDHGAALNSFVQSCKRLQKYDTKKLRDFGTSDDWQSICATAFKTPSTHAKDFFETYFQPHKILTHSHEKIGKFTGYYQPLLQGSWVKTDEYRYPIYRRPEQLSTKKSKIPQFMSRADIEAGCWEQANQHVLLWTNDPVQLFFLHIQGSGIVQMQDGTRLGIGYDGQNNHPYFPIGRELVRRGAMTKEEVSLQSIAAWLRAHPDQAQSVMNLNPSYVFFKKTDTTQAIGGAGVGLTPTRSMAIDHYIYPYGLPFWIETDNPALARLMIGQDTGGAINGAIRGDVFWGEGIRAEQIAGQMNSDGKMWVLLPD